LRRARQKLRSEVISEEKIDSIPALYFDGRKDKTLKIVSKGRKKYRQTIIEQHISIIKEPGSTYIRYAVPSHGTAKSLAFAIHVTLTSHLNISLNDTVAIGCDGTVVNTGKYGGVIRLLEKRLNRPLQWIVCLLHMNELPLRHLFSKLDGTTTGPATYSGVIGKLLDDCEKQNIVAFEKIEGVLPDISDAKDLSANQRYLYEITSAVIRGECYSDLANGSRAKCLTPGGLPKPTEFCDYTSQPRNQKLTHLATYVVKVYTPVWFEINRHPTCKDGARHFWRLIF
jgi:hypothetical protein